MILELVDPEHPEQRQRYECWQSDDRGTRQAFVEIAGKQFVVNVIPEPTICAKPSNVTLLKQTEKDACDAERMRAAIRLRPITTKVRIPERP